LAALVHSTPTPGRPAQVLDDQVERFGAEASSLAALVDEQPSDVCGMYPGLLDEQAAPSDPAIPTASGDSLSPPRSVTSRARPSGVKPTCAPSVKGAFIPIGSLTSRFSQGLFTLARNSRRSPEGFPTGGLVASPSNLSTMPICLRTDPQDSAMHSTTHPERAMGSCLARECPENRCLTAKSEEPSPRRGLGGL
jgi:hypothetical protein